MPGLYGVPQSLGGDFLANDLTSKTTFIDICFRDVADHDYIAARALFRIGLYHQFLWAALQALEKYLKAILLYNDISAKEISHEPLKALEKTEKNIPQIQPLVRDHEREFIKEIEAIGRWRYLEAPYRCFENSIATLDGSVWAIRRFCFQMTRLRPEYAPNGRDNYSHYIEYAQRDQHRDNPFEYNYFFNGHLEKLKSGKKGTQEQYENLVWKNLYFGKRRKIQVMLSPSCRLHKPPHFNARWRTSELLAWIQDNVRMDKSILNYLRSEECRG